MSPEWLAGSTGMGKRVAAVTNQPPKLYLGQFCGRIRMTFAACMKSVRRYLLPRFEMRPRIGLPHVLCWRGTRPSHAPKSRPRSKASPLPIAATTRSGTRSPRICSIAAPISERARRYSGTRSWRRPRAIRGSRPASSRQLRARSTNSTCRTASKPVSGDAARPNELGRPRHNRRGYGQSGFGDRGYLPRLRRRVA